MVSPSTSLYLSGISLLSWAFQTQGRCALFPSLLCHRRCSIALCRKRIDGIRPDPNRFLLQREPEHLPAVVDKLKRKLGHEENVHAFFLVRNKVEVAALEQKRLGIGNGSVGMFSSLIVRACRHALPFYHLLPIFSLQLASDAWFLNTPEQLLSFILADEGFDVWVGNVDGTRWSHGHRYYSVKNKELALYDMAEMINYIYSVTNSKLFIVGHSQALGLAYQRLGRYTAAIKSYGRAIELDDKMGVEQFRQALEISSQCVPAQYGLALGLLCLAKDCMNLGAFKWGASLLEVGKDEFG
ncbi:hypothetical protein Ahy_A07g035822 [Arachis hypogaea]|uniref:Uncharacterized protein n=1 Tax=Arachis hypogaea TaxID=3818 RepID=A0A445CEH1_ARAHY|nr:hypothetical protein Ahy_A07g035822 [Arachis hypogaea]